MSHPINILLALALLVASCGSEGQDAPEPQVDVLPDMDSPCDQSSCDEERFLVTLYYEGLNQPITVLEVEVGEAYGELPDPSRPGYAFAGWWTERLGKGERILSTDIVSVAKNHDLFAHWRSGKSMISAGHDHTCALKTDGSVWCTGSNDRGQYGDETLDNSATPVQVMGPDKYLQISASFEYTCGVKTDDTVACWGINLAAAHGIDYGESWNEPIHVVGLTQASNVTTSGRHACAARLDGTVWCWG